MSKHNHHKKHKEIKRGTVVRFVGTHFYGWTGVVVEVSGRGKNRRYSVRCKKTRKGTPIIKVHISYGLTAGDLKRVKKGGKS